MLRTFFCAILCLIVLPGASLSQAAPANEVGLLIGAAVTPNVDVAGPIPEQLQIGSGVSYQINYAHRLAGLHGVALYAEFPAVAIPLQDVTSSNGSAPINYDSFFITPSLRVKFRASHPVSPWLSVGGGYALFDESATRFDGSHNTTRGTSGGAAQFGGGVDFKTPVRFPVPLGLRAEVRDFYSTKPSYNLSTGSGLQHNLVFSGGLVLKF